MPPVFPLLPSPPPHNNNTAHKQFTTNYIAAEEIRAFITTTVFFCCTEFQVISEHENNLVLIKCFFIKFLVFIA